MSFFPGNFLDVASGGSGTRSLFAILGQSNANGHADVKDVTLVSGLATPYIAVRHYRQYANDKTDPLPWDTTFPQGPLKPRSHFYNSSSTNDGNMGPELTLGRRMDQYLGGRVNLVQCGIQAAAVGDGVTAGSILHPLMQFPTSPKPPDPPNALLQMIQYVQSVELSSGSSLAGIFWIQGESDAAVSAFASGYQANCAAVFAAFRAVWPAVPIVISRLSANTTYTYKTTVQAAQDALQAATSNTAIVNTDDLAVQGDGAHFTADAYTTLGTRLADAMVTLALRAPVTPTTTWTTDATSGRPRPANAYEWQNFMLSCGITNPGPSCAMMMQDPSAAGGGDGYLHDSIGGQIWKNSDAHTSFRNTVTGESALSFKWSSPANATRMGCGGTTFGPDPTTQSVTRILRMRTTSAPAAQGPLFYVSGNNNHWLMVWSQTNGKYRVYYPNGLSVDTVNSHVSSSFILVALQYNITFSTCTLYTSLEKLTVPYAAVTRGDTGIGCPSGYANVPDPTFECLFDLTFTGLAAEMTATQMRKFFTGMGETVIW